MTKKNLLKTLALTLSISLLAPFASKVHAKESQPDIISKAGIVMDYETGEVIYDKNGTERMALASTTKIMTALLFAENAKKTDQITYTESAKAQPPYTIDSEKMRPYGKEFKIGDTVDADTVMKGLLVYSGNDFAYMIADHVAGDADKFVAMMNAKAKELGLNNTVFGNPNGVPGPNGDVNFSTAYELARLTKIVYENEWIRETMQLVDPKVTLPGNTIVTLETRNKELGKNGNIGGKTGITNQAGGCFTGVYERNGRKLIGTVLKCVGGSDVLDLKKFEDLDSMMTYSYAADKEVYKKSGEEIDSVELEYKLFRFFGPTKTITAPVKLAEDVKLYSNSINDKETEIKLNSDNNDAWKVASENTTPLTVTARDFTTEVKGTVDVTTMQLINANLLVYLAVVAVVIIIIVLIVFIIKMMGNMGRKRTRRRRRY
ncbi:D-alanyl-D-alanine carboxypeptidase family protein [Clostridium paraputrificum]|uniref:D-alanyl-D-alanine carboxypeptidase family protein n=1 Tax=Clostridium TaxID=1485 RepID=UPI003D356D49